MNVEASRAGLFPLRPWLMRLRAWREPQRWRLATGLVLFVFATMHFLNHALGLVSLPVMEAAQNWRLAIWQNLPMTIVLYASFAIHAVLGIVKIVRRTTWRMPAWEALQIVFGLLIPLWLVDHIVGTRVIGDWAGFDYRYQNVLALLWPGLAVTQSLLIGIVWLHGCIGLHHWLKMRRWYHRAAPWLLALAILVPVLAVAGWITQARLVQLDPPAAPLLSSEQISTSTAILNVYHVALLIAAGVLALVLIGQRIVARLRDGVTVTYAGGRAVKVRPGATLLEIARANGIAHASVCGGRGRCTTCRVQIVSGGAALPAPNRIEEKALTRIGAPDGVRLACQIRPAASLTVRPLVPVAEARPGGSSDPYRWGIERQITVLFSDLRGFTTLSEQLYPYDAVFVLNRYFEVMASIVRAHDGVVDKFLGDGIMALFGVDGTPGAGAAKALAAAREMQGSLAQLNEELMATLPSPLVMGIGVHTGPAVLGRVGAVAGDAGPGLTALGDTVNIASRLEALNKEYTSMLIVSRATIEAADADLMALEHHDVAVRGRGETVRVYVVRDMAVLGAVPVSA